MRTQSFLARCLLGLVALTTTLQAQTRNLFVLPLSSNGAGIASSFSADPFASRGDFPSSSVANQVFTNGDNSRLYVIAQSGSQTVQILDAANPGTVINAYNLGQPAVAAALTADGRNLVVLTNRLNVISAITNSLATNTASTDVGQNPIDLATSIDARYAYVLSADSARLTSVDINSGTVAATQSFALRPTGVAVAPSGAVYVSAQGALYELDPATLAIRSTLTVQGSPGKLQFSPDGRYGIAVNTQPQTGSLLIYFDLVGRVVLGSIPQIASVDEQLTNLVVVSNTRAFARSARTNTLYDISLSPLGLLAATFNNAGTLNNVTAIGATNELPQSKYLFIGTTSGVYRADLSTAGAPTVGPLPLSFTPGAIAYTSTPSNAAPVTLQLFNDKQTVAVGSNFLPIVVRAIDANGRPVANAPVTFTNTQGVQITNASQVTNQLGIAQATVVAPNIAASFNVNVSVGIPGVSSAFTLAVGTSVPGGGQTGTSTISVYQGLNSDSTYFLFGGQGQLVLENFPALPPLGQPLAVQVKDNQGNVLANQQVTFTLTGTGALVAAAGGTCTVSGSTATCTTDANGVTYVGYFSGNTANGTQNPQDQIVATANGASITFYQTAYSSLVIAQPSVGLRSPTPGSVINLSAGVPSKGAIQVIVADRYGKGLPNVGVYLQRPADTTGAGLQPGPGAYCANGVNGVVLTDATGLASCDVVSAPIGTGALRSSQLGQGPILIVVGGGYRIFDTVQVNVTPGTASALAIISGNNQTGNAGTQLTSNVVIQVNDAGGNPLANQPVTFEAVTAGTATFVPATTTTDVNGRATTRVTVGSTPGTFQIRARSGSLTTLLSFTVAANLSQIVVSGGSNQTAQVGQAFGQSLTVVVRDSAGNVVPNATVQFAVTSGSATLSASSATTNAQGQATVNVTAGQSAGPVVVTASIGGLSTTFNLTVQPLGPTLSVSSFANAASFESGAITPGGITTITARGIAPGVQGVVVPTNIVGQLPTTLNGTTVLVNGIPAPIYSIVNLNGVEQVTVQIPFETPLGNATVTVNTNNGGTATITGVPVVAYQPGIFETGDSSQRYAVAIRGNDGAYMTPSTPLQRGQNATIFLTGLGQTTPPTGTNRSGQANQNVAGLVVVALESTGVPFISASLLQGDTGVYAVSFTVPQNAPTGPVKIGVTIYTPGTVVNGTNSFSSIVYIQ